MNSHQDDSESNSVPLSFRSDVNQERRQGFDFGADRTRDSKKVARAVRFRIMALMVLLLAVIFAMKEAGKPERWMWMGFDKIDQSPKEGDFLVDASDGSSKAGPQGALDWSIAKSASGPPGKLLVTGGTDGDKDATGLNATEFGRLSDNELDREFWQAAYKRLSGERQLQLFELLRKVVRSDFSPLAETDVAELKKIIKRLIREQSDFQTLGLSEISLLNDSKKKKEKTEALFEFDQRWQVEVVPTLNAAIAGDDYSFGGQVEIGKVVRLLRPQFLGAVEDMAGMGTRGDLPGWMTVWDETVAGRPLVSLDRSTSVNSSAGEVSFLQLSGQPDNYRGKQVSVSGQARTCRKKMLKQTRLPVDHYYEVWIEPLDVDGDGLFCVYAAEIPKSFPRDLVEQDTGRFHEVDVPVSLTGRFFKVRSYRDLGDGVSHSPVVIARQIDSVDTGLATEVTGARAIPNATYLAFWFAGVVAVGTGLAIAIFRTSRTRSPQLGQSSAKRTHRSLEMLEQDQSIKSHAQRVAELKEDDNDQSERGMEQENEQ